jgi:hypothetical protein
VAEVPERVEDNERPLDGDVEDFRERLFEDYGPDELEPPEWNEQQEASGTERPVDQLPAEADKGGAVNESPEQELAGPDEPASASTPEIAPPEPARESQSKDSQESIGEAERPDQERTTSDATEPDEADAATPSLAEEAPEDAPVKIESFSQNDNQIVVTEHEGPEEPGKVPPSAEVETWDFHHFPSGTQVEREDEVRTFEAVDYGKGDVVRIPKTDLEGEGFEPEPGRNAIVQLGLRGAESEEVETAFARYSSSDRRAEVYVDDIGCRKGSRYELVEAREVDEDTLVRDFERGKCEHLENVRLEHVDEKMFLNVDERRVELEDYRISTSGAHAVLRGRLDGDDSCKVEFDGRRASVKFGRDYPVEGMRMEEDVLAVNWAQSRSEKHETRFHLEHLGNPERPSLNEFADKAILDRVEMIERPQRPEGTYQLAIDRPIRDEVQRLLADAGERGDRSYGKMKAEISERLVPNVLELAGWERIQWHPFNTTEKEGVNAPGTDWLVRTPDGKVVLLEIKWYEDQRQAIRKATTQVEKDFRQHHGDPDLKLEGAYIAIVDYDEDNKNGKPFRIHVLRIVRQEELR